MCVRVFVVVVDKMNRDLKNSRDQIERYGNCYKYCWCKVTRRPETGYTRRAGADRDGAVSRTNNWGRGAVNTCISVYSNLLRGGHYKI